MGAWLFRADSHSGDRVDLVDFTLTFVDGRNPRKVRAPACLDELVDWAHSASKMINDLKDGDEIIFLPYIKTSTVQEEYRKRDTVSQKHLLDFPQKSAFELSVFYEANVIIVSEKPTPTQAKADGQQLKPILSLADFCEFYLLLRRYSELMDIGRPSLLINSSTQYAECSICMGQTEDLVLPCLHGMCSSCAKKWVGRHKQCPFCRKYFEDRRRMEKDQWELQKWQQNLLENDICELESKIKSFWYQRGTYGSVTAEEWMLLESSFSCCVVHQSDYIYVD